MICVCASFGKEDGIRDLIVLVPDHCLFILFDINDFKKDFYLS